MTQRSFDPLDYLDAGIALTMEQAHKMARQTRDAELRDWRKTYGAGLFRFKGFALSGQLRPYKAWGIPDGSIRTVYYIDTNCPAVPHGCATRSLKTEG